jgi:hypothetical protein
MSSLDLRQETKGFTWGTFWITLSAILHIALVVCLVFFTPIRDWFLTPADPADALANVSSRRISEAVQKMLDAHTLRMAEDLERAQQDLAELNSRRDRVYDQYVTDMQWLIDTRKQQLTIVPLESIQPAQSRSDELSKLPLREKTLFELYDLAQDMEQAAIESYRQMQAIELSRLQGGNLVEASEITQIPIPQHRELKVDIFYQQIDNVNDGRMDDLKKELAAARGEVSSIVAYIARMLDLAKGLMGDDVDGFSVVSGDGIMTIFGDGDYMRRWRPETGLFQGYSPPDPRAFGHPWGDGVGPVTHRDELYPKEMTQLGDELALPGRKIMSEGTLSGAWMYIDTWYIIGPFPNPNREMIDYPYPPEARIDTGIDLDARYKGWKGQPVQWRFRKSKEICILPHDPRDGAIWYAYSEVYADRDQKRICIFGSDDFGKAWVNGEPVYGSGTTPHPWIPDRAYKPVRFRKGFNPILFKLENAWGRTGFSMCILVGEEA